MLFKLKVIESGTKVLGHKASIVLNSKRGQAQLATLWDFDPNDMNSDPSKGVFVDLTRQSIDELINELVRVQTLLP